MPLDDQEISYGQIGTALLLYANFAGKTSLKIELKLERRLRLNPLVGKLVCPF